MSLQEVTEEIALAREQLTKATSDGFSFDNPGVVALRNNLTALIAYRTSLISSSSGKS